VILAAGLTPAWQQVLVFDEFKVGHVNRARQAHWCASGKVLNVARALHHLGSPANALTLVGGNTGAAIQHDFTHLGIAARWIEAATPTRVCTTILDSIHHAATELVPEVATASTNELDAFQAAYAEEVANAAVVVLIGSLPVATPARYYRDLLRHTPGKAILDARGPELVEALAEKPFLVKPNREEVERTLGRELHDDHALFDAMRQLNGWGAEWVVITDGKNPIHASSGGQIYQLRPPPREVVNPIGCGDCMTAGIAWATAHGREPLEAIRFGVAVAADKLGRLLPGLIDRGEAEALVPQIKVTCL
jgi:1-phosphofructokinase family hexose kinase